MKICLDAGHGGSSTGAAGNYSTEKDIVLKLTFKLRDKLEGKGVSTILTRSDDSYLDLQERCDIANKANCDCFISIHCNGYSDKSASGTETFHKAGSMEGKKLAQVIQSAAVEYNKNKDRGVKTADFYVLNGTNMTAVLHEIAFVTNASEEDMLNNSDWLEGFVNTLADAICSYAGASPVLQEALYKLSFEGIFDTKENPTMIAEDIMSKASSGSVKVTGTNGEIILNKMKQGDGSVPNQISDSFKHPISGISKASAKQMESFVHRINPNAPYLAQKYLDIGSEEGIRGDMAYAQAILETGYFRFTGVVKPEQNNFCGLGATGPGRSGAFFPSADYGIKVHVQHLKAYANKEPVYSMPVVDPRFHLVSRGTAPDWEDLNGRWAVPGDRYGESIVEIWREILNEPV